jgi:hypothetical protein
LGPWHAFIGRPVATAVEAVANLETRSRPPDHRLSSNAPAATLLSMEVPVVVESARILPGRNRGVSRNSPAIRCVAVTALQIHWRQQRQITQVFRASGRTSVRDELVATDDRYCQKRH